jgi:hypothetical protein
MLDKIYYSHFYKWKIYILQAYIKFGTKLFHMTWLKKMKCKIGHGKSEEKGEFGSSKSESLCFNGGTPMCFNPNN